MVTFRTLFIEPVTVTLLQIFLATYCHMAIPCFQRDRGQSYLESHGGDLELWVNECWLWYTGEKVTRGSQQITAVLWVTCLLRCKVT